ncbi:MAG: glycoside hydrolase family 9 protein [Cytophagales bacterium]
MRRINSIIVLTATLIMSALESTAQPFFTNNDYKKAIWMTTRFYGAQRSGNDNWTLHNHLPTGAPEVLRGTAFRLDRHTADNYDLSGGWHDCGDHVKFGQTQFYSAYLLIKGYAEFPTGYIDMYSQNYAGYKAANNWNYEGTAHDPNCIPDVLDEMKHETDWLIKITPNGSNFYWQVGNGGGSADHATWTTATQMQRQPVNQGGNNDNGGAGGPFRPACKNPADASMPSFAGAALAVMSRVYRKWDPAYANLCLTHALNAYTYAKANPGTTGTCFGGFYPAARNWRAAFASLCAELYWTTGNDAYRTEALSYSVANMDVNPGWSFDYSNFGEIGLYNLAKLGSIPHRDAFNSRITGHFLAAASRNAAGVYTAYGDWGRLRYNGNAAFLIALYSVLNNITTPAVINAIHNDVDYIMGKNSNKRSYITGFEPAANGPYLQVQYPHHRNVYLRDDNPANTAILTIPAKNRQLGALVGGQRNGTYNDDRNDYVNSEVCIDYNVGLVGALGFIMSRLAPVDTAACGTVKCKKPELGPNLSTCSGTVLPVSLNSNVDRPSGVTFSWFRNGTQISGQSNATCVGCGTVAGTYIVVRDSATCSRRDTLVISNTIPTPDLGSTRNVCTPANYTLTPTNLSSFPVGTSYQWAYDASGGTTFTNLENQTNSSLANVRAAGRYRLTATAGTCTNNGTVLVTSNLPTPVDNCRVDPGSMTLAISNPGLNGTNYNWYTTATGGTPVCSGTTSCNVTVASTTTYFVQDMSSVNTNVGPTSLLGAQNNWGVNAGNQLNFTVSSNFSILSMKIPFNIYGTGSGNVTIEILDGSGNSFTPARTFVSNNTNATATGQQLLTFTFSNLDILASWGPNLRMRINNKTHNGDPLWSSGPAAYPYSVSGVVSITGRSGGENANNYMYFYDWQISTGNSCSRLPVLAQVGACTTPTPVTFVSVRADRKNTGVLVKWSVALQENITAYSVQVSENGMNFREASRVPASNRFHYEFADFESSNSNKYYKIVAIEEDGTFSSSNIVFVNGNENISLSPNPTSDGQFEIVSSSRLELLKIFDSLGNLLKVYENLDNISSFDISDLPAGMYVVKASMENDAEVFRLVKE